MAITHDPVALNQYLPVAYPGKVLPGTDYDTQLLGQPIRVSADKDGTIACHVLEASGEAGRNLPVVEKFAVLFTTLGDAPRRCPRSPNSMNRIGESSIADRWA